MRWTMKSYRRTPQTASRRDTLTLYVCIDATCTVCIAKWRYYVMCYASHASDIRRWCAITPARPKTGVTAWQSTVAQQVRRATSTNWRLVTYTRFYEVRTAVNLSFSANCQISLALTASVELHKNRCTTMLVGCTRLSQHCIISKHDLSSWREKT